MPVPTSRLLLIALTGVVLIPLAPSVGAAVVIACCWFLAGALLAVIDTRFVPAREELVWVRRHDTKLSLGAWNPITLTLANRSNRPVNLQARDAVPRLLLPRGEAGSGMCPTGATWTLAYGVYPIHRGDYTFGPVSARYLGPLGLAWRSYTAPIDGAFKVYPDLLAVRRYEALMRVGHPEEIGLHNSRRWGSGTEFERLRDYTPDDEFRRINWNATARRHKLVAVDYETERSQNVILLLDAGRLMSTRLPVPASSTPLPRLDEGRTNGSSSLPLFPKWEREQGGEGTPPLTRLDYTVNTALLLAFVSQRHGDRIGLLAFGDHVTRYLTPAPGRRQFLGIAEALYDLEAEPTEADYAEAIGYLTLRNPRRSLVVLFTDIADPEAASALVSLLGRLARRHLPLVVTLRDPSIERLASLPATGSKNVYERAVARSVLEDRDQTLRHLRRQGVLTLDVSVDRLSPALINRYLEIKARTAL